MLIEFHSHQCEVVHVEHTPTPITARDDETRLSRWTILDRQSQFMRGMHDEPHGGSGMPVDPEAGIGRTVGNSHARCRMHLPVRGW